MPRLDQAILLTSALFAGVLTGGGKAWADDIARATSAGKEVLVTQVTLITGKTCVGAVPPLTFIQKPIHGKIELRPSQIVAHGGKCVGQTVNGGLIFYIPDAGFTGNDTFTFNYIWGVGNKGNFYSPNYATTITVK